MAIKNKLNLVKNSAHLLKTGLGYAIASARGRAAGRRYLLETLQSGTGIHAKFGQILAMKWPENQNSAGENNKINNVEKNQENHFHKSEALLSAEQISELLKIESPAFLNQIISIDQKAYAASLGQVHFAKLKSSEQIAFKVQYPDVQEEIQSQFKTLMKLSAASPAKRYNFNFDEFSNYLSGHFFEETDYLHEARVQKIFYKKFESFSSSLGDKVVIPEVFLQYSTQKLLVQSCEPITDFSQVVQWSEAHRRRCSVLFVESFLHSLFQLGHIHSDLNPGNWGFRKSKKNETSLCELVYYDFGSTLVIPQQNQLLALVRLVSDIQSRKNISPLAHFSILGFDIEKLKFIAPQLPALCERLFMPLLSERAFLPAEWDLAGHFDRILGDNKWWFRMAGPPWFFLLMRSVQGLCWAIDKLNVPISIATCWQHATAHLELESQLLKLNLPEKYSEFSTISSFDKFAKQLCIRITENGREKINLSLPVRIVDEIESYLPLETVSEIKEAGENLSEIKLRIQRSGYVPQNVLSKQIDSKKFEVFLV